MPDLADAGAVVLLVAPGEVGTEPGAVWGAIDVSSGPGPTPSSVDPRAIGVVRVTDSCKL